MIKSVKKVIKGITPTPVLDYYRQYRDEKNLRYRDKLKQKRLPAVQKCLDELNEKRSIDIGKFLQSVGNKIVLSELTFVGGEHTA